MKKVIEMCTCDICGKEGAKTYKTLAYRTFDGTDGMSFYSEPKFEEVKLDICDECAIKITNLHSIGVCCERFEIMKYHEM